MTLASSIWPLTPAGNGKLYSGYPAGNPPQPSWTAIPNYLSQATSLSVNIKTTYLNPTSGPTLALVGALPTGWAFNGTTLTYDGSGVAGPASIAFDATYLGSTVRGNTFQVQGIGSVPADTSSPSIPLALAVTSNLPTSVTLSGSTSADPSPGATWSGLKRIAIKRGGSVIGYANQSNGNQAALTLTDIGTAATPSTLNQTGADLAMTSVAVDSPYPTVDGLGFAYQQLTGTNWTVTCRVDAFAAANTFSNLRLTARASLASNAAYVATMLHPFAGNVGFRSEYRGAQGGNATTLQSAPNTTAPAWLRLTRNGDVYTFAYSLDGNTFLPLGSRTQVMGSTLYVGAGLNTNAGVSISATIKDLSIQTLVDWSYTDNTVSQGTTYAYSASAEDNASNASAFGPTLSVTTPSPQTIRWNPGYYMVSNFTMTPSNLGLPGAQGQLDIVGSTAAFRGYMLRLSWGSVEGAKNDYSGIISRVKPFFDILKGYATPKRFAVGIEWGTPFGSSASPTSGVWIPSYLTTDPANGASPTAGQYGWWGSQSGSSYDYKAAVHRAAVRARMDALIAAFQAAFGADPYFEGVRVFENAGTSSSLSGAPDWSWNALNTQETTMAVNACATLTTCNFCIANNFDSDRAATASFMAQFTAASRAGYSAPDLWGATAETNHGIDSGNTWAQNVLRARAWNGSSWVIGAGPTYIGKMPIWQEVQDPELTGSQFVGIGSPFTPADIITHANQIGATHLFFQYVASGAGNTGSQITAMQAQALTNTAYPYS